MGYFHATTLVVCAHECEKYEYLKYKTDDEHVTIGLPIFQTLPDGQKIGLPPVLLGQLGKDPKKKTVCLYGHLDVQPALKVIYW